MMGKALAKKNSGRWAVSPLPLAKFDIPQLVSPYHSYFPYTYLLATGIIVSRCTNGDDVFHYMAAVAEWRRVLTGPVMHRIRIYYDMSERLLLRGILSPPIGILHYVA